MGKMFFRDCKICGRPFQTMRENQVYCGKICRAKNSKNYSRLHSDYYIKHSPSSWYKMRWDVFHRDNFTCQYCGRKAPSTILECDHIIPESKHGKTTMSNLITSCKSCNIGKGDTLLKTK